jgi:hypothetical protein
MFEFIKRENGWVVCWGPAPSDLDKELSPKAVPVVREDGTLPAPAETHAVGKNAPHERGGPSPWDHFI